MQPTIRGLRPAGHMRHWTIAFAAALVAVLAACAPASLSPSPADSAPQTALELLECDGPPSELGGIGPFGVVTQGNTPQEAFSSWLADPIFVVPVNNWEPYAPIANGAVFVYRNGEQVKVVAVISTTGAVPGEGRFTLSELRACESAEFGPQAVFAGGDRVWANAEGLILRDIAGAAHCGWQLARLLHIEEADSFRQYVADPVGVLQGASLVVPFDGEATLPPDATDSGYRSGDLELWFVPDQSAIYVVAPDHVELWPRADPPIGCA